VGYVALAARVIIGVLFLGAAASKVRSAAAREAFRTAVSALVPRAPAGALSVGVIAAEVVIVVLVALPVTAVAGLLLAVAVLTAFSFSVWAALRRGVRTSCRCFGWSETPLSRTPIVRNAVLVVVAVAGVFGALSAPVGGLHPGGTALSISVALVLVVGLSFADDLAFLWSA
jgi:hypothetical protein